jgi:hypothetical protein
MTASTPAAQIGFAEANASGGRAASIASKPHATTTAPNPSADLAVILAPDTHGKQLTTVDRLQYPYLDAAAARGRPRPDPHIRTHPVSRTLRRACAQQTKRRRPSPDVFRTRHVRRVSGRRAAEPTGSRGGGELLIPRDRDAGPSPAARRACSSSPWRRRARRGASSPHPRAPAAGSAARPAARSAQVDRPRVSTPANNPSSARRNRSLGALDTAFSGLPSQALHELDRLRLRVGGAATRGRALAGLAQLAGDDDRDLLGGHAVFGVAGSRADRDLLRVDRVCMVNRGTAAWPTDPGNGFTAMSHWTLTGVERPGGACGAAIAGAARGRRRRCATCR